MEQLGRRVRRWRRRRGLTQEQLAIRVGVSRPYIARVEAGRHEVRVTTLARMAKALRVATAQLLG